ncbi:hypothetical protein GCM10010517_34160 [Streptosporangium fragile]|uniref:GntR family transcriptional regulator n=1 Tax=Streptosporangium fragile TaxID=46186 RepID=A0ABP6IFF2_9ACTN
MQAARTGAGAHPPGVDVQRPDGGVELDECSTGTARKVLTRLKDQGVAYSVPGLGTFVAGRDSAGA